MDKHKEKLVAKQSVAKQSGSGRVSLNKLKILITVVGRSKAEYYTDLIQGYEVNLQMLALAHGTADAKTLGLLGLTDTEKGVIFSVVQASKVPDIMQELSEKFNTIKDGKGIAFTIPLTSVIGKLIYGFLSNTKSVVKEEK